MTASDNWARALASWAIPQHILDEAPQSPWGFSPALFARRADEALSELTPSNLRALEALPEGGTVLDVGCGAGAASLPLARKAGHLVGVDASADMLAAFRERAVAAGPHVTALQGTWPDVARDAPIADVVVCHHVAYNVPDLAAFARALTSHARVRVVTELTARHPMSVFNDLWLHFHGLERPRGPTAGDVEAVLRELGLSPQRDERTLPALGPFESQDELIATVRGRLCLSPARDPEVEAAIAPGIACRPDGTLVYGERAVVTLWWGGAATAV